MSLFILTSAKPVKNKKLIGNWKLIKATTNRKPNPPEMDNRTWEFKNRNQFIGKISIQQSEKTYNKGIYLLANDSTMLTTHFDLAGQLSRLSFTYNFHIKKDSLHLYGIY